MTNDQKVVAISRRIVKAHKFPPNEEMNDEIKQQHIKSTNDKKKALALRREFWLDNIHRFGNWIHTQPMSAVSCYNVKPQKPFDAKFVGDLVRAFDSGALGRPHFVNEAKTSHE